MKVLFVNEKAGYFGGVEQNVADAARELGRRGISCFLAYGEPTDRGTDEYRSIFEAAAACKEISSNPEPGAQPFREIVGRLRPDVLYLHKVANVSCVTPFLGKIRTVRMVHDHDLCCPRKHKYYLVNSKVCHHPAGFRCYLDLAFLERDPNSPFGFRYSPIARKLEEMKRNYNFDIILVGSRFMQKELVQNGFSPERVHILPPVVPEKDVSLTPLPDDPAILYVGQLIRGKGCDLLLQSLRKISCEFTAVFVGTGNAEGKLRALCKTLKLDHKVRFAGWVHPKDIGTFYAKAKVVAVPSRWPEPFGMIGLEAMRHGRPVVAFDVGGIPDWLENGVNGFLVSEQDIDGLANALERIVRNSELAKRLGREGLKKARDHFSFERYVDRLLAFLEGSAT